MMPGQGGCVSFWLAWLLVNVSLIYLCMYIFFLSFNSSNIFFTGTVASIVDIGTTWMTDLKYGICPEAFWLDREQCCWSSNQTAFGFDNCSQVYCNKI
jgi:hypothetical protein